MKFKKVLASLTAAVMIISTASLAGLAKTNSVAAASINSTAKKDKYVGTTFLYKLLATEGIKYNKFYSNKDKIVYRNHGKPEGIVIHETADPGASAQDEAIYFNREWGKIYAYVHAFADHKQVIQMMTPNYGVWGAGPMANSRFVQIELCEETTRNNFAKSVNNDAIWSAQILHRYHLKPVNATHTGKGTVWSHHAVSTYLGGTDHTDPDGYFKRWGYSMDQFFDLIKYYYNLQAGKPKPAKKPQVSHKLVAKMPKLAKNQKVISHDSCIYTSKARRTKTIKHAGTIFRIYGTKKIKGRKYYRISKTGYIVASNIDGQMRKLRDNAYVYNTAGISDGRVLLLKKSKVRTYGSTVKILGVKYYHVSPTQFVKAENF